MNTTTDMEMEEMETETKMTNHSESVKGLLAMAHQFINEGKPSQAVVLAMKSEEAVFRTLHRACLVKYRLKVTAATDELASLFAEAKPSKVEWKDQEIML